MLELNFNPFPEIQTERLILRKLTSDDKEALFEMRSNPEVMKYIPRPLAVTIDDALAHLEMSLKLLENNEAVNWAIQEKGSTRMIGSIGIFNILKEHYRAEIGYILNPKWHGKGIMDEALKSIIAFGFENMKLHSIEALIDPGNSASAKLLEKNKFRKEGHYKENCFFEGRFLDSGVYSIVRGIDYLE